MTTEEELFKNWKRKLDNHRSQVFNAKVLSLQILFGIILMLAFVNALYEFIVNYHMSLVLVLIEYICLVAILILDRLKK